MKWCGKMSESNQIKSNKYAPELRNIISHLDQFRLLTIRHPIEKHHSTNYILQSKRENDLKKITTSFTCNQQIHQIRRIFHKKISSFLY